MVNDSFKRATERYLHKDQKQVPPKVNSTYISDDIWKTVQDELFLPNVMCQELMRAMGVCELKECPICHCHFYSENQKQPLCDECMERG